MSFQIKSIGLYNADNEFHELKFNLNSPNIIIGNKDTGKSSVLAIINYCLCANDSVGLKDKVRNYVEFYGIHLINLKNQEMIVIRKKPPTDNPNRPETKKSTQYYIKDGTNLSFPVDISKELFQFDNSAARQKLGFFTGLDLDFCNNVNENISIRHPLSLNFLDYKDLADQEVCFHQQKEVYHFRDFRDFFPYFLGLEGVEIANYRQKRAQLEQQLRSLNSEQKKIENSIAEKKKDPLFKQIEGTFSLSSIEDIFKFDYDALQLASTEEQKSLDTKIKKCQRMIVQLEKRKEVLEGFQNNSNLKSEDLISTSESKILSHCPLCSQDIKKEIPKIEDLKKEIGIIASEKSNFKQEIKDIEEKIQIFRAEKQNLLKLLAQLPKRNEDNKSPEIFKMLVFLGKLQQLFENNSNDTSKKEDLNKLKEELYKIEQKIDEQELSSARQEVLSKISEKITKMLETILNDGAPHLIKFNIKTLLPWEETAGGTSHQIARKISTYLVLHRHFIEANRPIPRFLVIDQFSQSNSGGSGEEDSDDKNTINAILKEIFKLTELQSIILEHVDYSKEDEEFDKKVIQRWVDGEGLLPQSWITDSNEESSI